MSKRKMYSIHKNKVVIGLVISGVLLYLSFLNTDFYKIYSIIESLNYRYLFLAIGVDFLILFIKSVKWGYLIQPIKKVKVFTLFSVISIGTMTNSLLPFRIDELIRAYILGRREGLKKSMVFGTIVVERIMDAVDSHRGETDLHDDITLVVARR